MPKPKPIQINIPNPCNQSWDGMTLSGQGRFCDHCQKTVIDFTTWSDAALYQYFSKDTGHTCGRFLATQLDRPIHIPHQPHSRLYRMTIALGLTLLFTQTPHLLAQNRPPKTTQTTTEEQPDSTTVPSFGEIRGQVLDTKKEPLINATVQVFQNGISKGGTITDYDGFYTIKSLPQGIYDVTVRYARYDTVKDSLVTIIAGRSTDINYEMKPNFTGMEEFTRMGGYRTPLINRTSPPDPAQNSVPVKKHTKRKHRDTHE